MIKVEGLTRAYGSFIAVDDVSFECKPGTVTGFLGPNGAGKTTTMRVMVGLTPPPAVTSRSGACTTSRSPTPADTSASCSTPPRSTPGVPVARSSRSGPAPWACAPTRVDEMLDLVSLDARESKRRVRNYSLGMRQRLGIAHALLGDPSVLILDEPANGLDPAGIRWMRGLLKGYADQGGTVLLSSHLLHEVEQIADEMILIGNGKIVARGTREELLKDATGGVATTLVTALDNQQLSPALTEKGLAVHPAGDGLRVTAEPVDVGRVAAEKQIVLTDLRAGNEGGLEDLFLELTADTQREAVPGQAPTEVPA